MQAVTRSCVASLNKAIRRQGPTHALCVMDSDQPSWRHLEYPQYKSNRAAMPEALKQGLDEVLRQFQLQGVKAFRHVGFEADDVIATIAVKVAGADGQVTILSTDKSLCQVLRSGVRIYDHFSDRYLDADYVRGRFEVESEQLATFQSLVGETSVNVSGVHGIGKRTASKLIHDYGELKTILQSADHIGGNIGKKLRDGARDAKVALRLLTLRTDLDLGLNLRDFRINPVNS